MLSVCTLCVSVHSLSVCSLIVSQRFFVQEIPDLRQVLIGADIPDWLATSVSSKPQRAVAALIRIMNDEKKFALRFPAPGKTVNLISCSWNNCG